jgi:hypothetical protein
VQQKRCNWPVTEVSRGASEMVSEIEILRRFSSFGPPAFGEHDPGKPIRSSNGFVVALLLTSHYAVTRSDIERKTKWT